MKNKEKEKHKKLEQDEAGFLAVPEVGPSCRPLNDPCSGLGETVNRLASCDSCQNLGSF